VLCNGNPAHQFIATAANNDHTFAVNFPAAPANVATLTFMLPNAVSPMSLGFGEDPRLLGLSFGTATLH
jgi:hypothetical protein